MNWIRRTLVTACWLVVFTRSVSAQQAETRYELGKRVQAFEMAWDTKANDPAVKKRVAPVANQAVQNFFRFNFAGVGQTMDQARHLLASTDDVPADVRWAESLYVVPEARLLDAKTNELTLTVKPFYKVDVSAPKTVLRVQWGQAKASDYPLNEVPATVKATLPATMQASDEALTVRIISGERTLAEHRFLLSRVPTLTERIDALKKISDGQPRTTIEQATLAQQVKLLNALAQRVPQETDYPAARLLAEAEELARATSEVYTRKRSGEYWLSVPTGKTATAIRLHVPASKGDQPMPVVVALHGMGGSENMFFDAYGNGIVPKLAKERGWLIVATRVEGLLGAGAAPNVPALLDELHKRYAFDTKRVYLVGHSMGAGHAMQLVQQAPTRYAGVAALGGGGRIAKADAIKGVPFFVGCGKLDFALNGARSLAKSLDGGKVTLKEYDDIEHLIIVREAAPDVFAFFDGLK